MWRRAVLFSLTAVAFGQKPSGTMLPDGRDVISWERPTHFNRTYYVDNGNPAASDSNPGTRESAFRTIGKAAEVLQPGQRVVIESGVYRERVARAGRRRTRSDDQLRSCSRRARGGSRVAGSEIGLETVHRISAAASGERITSSTEGLTSRRRGKVPNFHACCYDLASSGGIE